MMLHKLGTPVRYLPVNWNKSLLMQAATLKLNTLDSAEWAKALCYKEIPGPTKYQFIRGFLPGGKYHKKPFTDFLLHSRVQYGEIYRIPGLFGKKDSVMTFNVDDFEKVFRTEGVWPARPGIDSLVHYRTKYRSQLYNNAKGLLTSRGKGWEEFRAVINPILMETQNDKNFITRMQEVNSEFIQRIRETRDPFTREVPENFIDEINRLTFESVAVVALNDQLGLIRTDRNRADAKQLFACFQDFLQLMYDLEFKPPLWKYVWTPTYARFKKALDVIYDTISMYVNEAVQRFENEKRADLDDNEISVLEKLIKIDKSIAIVMAVEMLMAGVDNTSSILSGILLEVAKHPEKQAILREEIRKVLPSKKSTFTVESMKNLPYLRACIKEGIRLHPVGPGIQRETGEDIALMGYQIPKGTQVILNINLTFKENGYFPRPKDFLPERWIRDGPLENDAIPFSYLPFGFGPRMCAGKRIVDLELEVNLARLVRNFYIEFKHPIDNAFKSYPINTPAIPLTFRFIEVEN